MQKVKKVLVLGSGALQIGQAGEFDYSGSQAIKGFKEEGIKTILINPNIATVQTSEFLADEVYFLPINEYFVEKIIEKEKPDAIALSFGGQTALNCGIALHKKGILKKHNITVLGTPIDSIILTEDRQLFADHLRKIAIPTPASQATDNLGEAKKIASTIGYPVMIRAAYALGGQKSGVAFDAHQLETIVKEALDFSSQVLIEKYLHHFKEIEYEVIRDVHDNCVTVCNMENFDPLGIHTGESIVVAPSQTLDNTEYHTLRTKAIEIVRSLGIIGECNVQYALNPKPETDDVDFYVIEVNARLSRSSALASKATGYPLAYVASKLILGKSMMEVKNQVTQVTQACFEPALDYLVIKFPRWDLDKFKGVQQKLGSSMKSVGEIMAIGRTFEEALQKAVRMLDLDVEGITDSEFESDTEKLLNQHIRSATPQRIFALAEAMKRGISVSQLYKYTGVDPWFLHRIQNIVETEREIVKSSSRGAKRRSNRSEIASLKSVNARNDVKSQLLQWKQRGFSDKRIGKLLGKTGLEIREMRKKWKILPSIFSIDTLAGEIPAKTNYLYLTYNGEHNDVKPIGANGVIVLGSGPYHIGSSVEFDWTCVNTALHLKKYKKKSIIINCNPETVSTDYDITDRLYFEELSFERVADIYEFENPGGAIVSVGGQRPNTLAYSLSNYGFNLYGTKAVDIDRAEDRNKFSQLLDTLGVLQPAWNKFTSLKEAEQFAARVGYPVLIRPSYVLSGSAMNVCYSHKELKDFVGKSVIVNAEYPVTVSKFFSNSKEIELDAVAQNGEVKIFAVSEHIEHAGVHSGDATIVYPTQQIFTRTENQLADVAKQLAKALHITGPFNIQFIAKDNKVYVIEANLRASRTFPFISKATRVNYAHLIVDAIFNNAETYKLSYPDYVLVKAAQTSFSRLEGADPVLRVEMSSTGEVACFGDEPEEAFLKAIYATKATMHSKAALLSIGGVVNKKKFLESAELLEKMGFKLYATSKTHTYLTHNGINNQLVHKFYEHRNPHVVDLIENKKVGLVINISDPMEEGEAHAEDHNSDGYLIRRATIDNNIPLFTNINSARYFVRAITNYTMSELQVKAWSKYV